MITKIRTGTSIQYECSCGNIYDLLEEAESCQHDFYDENGESIEAQSELDHLSKICRELNISL